MAAMILYKEELDKAKCTCGQPGCDHSIFIHSQCHIEAPTWCEYSNGFLKITCSKCGKVTGLIAVATREGKNE